MRGKLGFIIAFARSSRHCARNSIRSSLSHSRGSASNAQGVNDLGQIVGISTLHNEGNACA